MKRTFIIRNIIIAIIIIAVIVAGFFFFKKSDTEYEIGEIKNYNYFVLKQDEKTGVIGKNGNTIIEPEYDEVIIPNPEKPIFACYNGTEVKLLDADKKQLFTEYEKVEPIRLKDIASDLMYEKTVLKYKEDEKYGLINLEGKKITKAIYDEIESLPYKEGALLVKQEEKYGVINIAGKTEVSSDYGKIRVDAYHTNGVGYKYAGYIVSNTTEQGYRYGYVDYKGKKLLPTEYNEISRIIDIEDKDNVYLIVAKNGQYGVINNDKELIKNEYQSISYNQTNKLLTIEKTKKYGIATLDGKIILPEEYDQIDIKGLYLYAKKVDNITVYDSKGTKADIDKNVIILDTENENYKIKINTQDGTKYGVIGKNGEQIIEEKYSNIEYLGGDYFRVGNEKSKLGVIDSKGTEKIAIENDAIQKVEETNIIQATIIDTETTVLYDSNMTKICEMKKAELEVEENYIKIYNNEETKYFDKNGKELNAYEIYSQNNLFAKKENDKWGFADKENKMVVEAKYDEVTEINEFGFAGVKKDGLWGVVNSKGEEILKPTYKFQEGIEPSFINTYYKVEYGFGEVYYTNAR